MKIMVTGGAGFIGAHVVNRYIEEGHEVVVVDNLCSGLFENIHPRAKFYLVDIRSKELESVFTLEKPELVNHLAAQKSVPLSIQNPMLDIDINLNGLINVLNLCIRFDVKKVIFASTGGAIYGDADQIPSPETSEFKMSSPYAVSKFTGEKYIHIFQNLYGLNFTILRLANVYGPRQHAAGECGVIPIFIHNLLHRIPSTMYTYPDMPDGTTRDYVYVDDVCDANVLALTRGDQGTFNIGTGRETSLRMLYHLLQEIAGVQLPLQMAPERKGDVRRSVLLCWQAQLKLGWNPKTELEEGLRATYHYYQNQFIGKEGDTPWIAELSNK